MAGDSVFSYQISSQLAFESCAMLPWVGKIAKFPERSVNKVFKQTKHLPVQLELEVPPTRRGSCLYAKPPYYVRK